MVEDPGSLLSTAQVLLKEYKPPEDQLGVNRELQLNERGEANFTTQKEQQGAVITAVNRTSRASIRRAF